MKRNKVKVGMWVVVKDNAVGVVGEHIGNTYQVMSIDSGDGFVYVDVNKAGGFKAQINYNGFLKHVGLFDNPQDAFMAYKVAKEAQIKLVAMQYKDVLKPAVYESLMNWEILSDD